jgi:DNA repair exonuclease SbcCD nuclease subunit
MVYITGDTHIPIDITKLSSKRFPEQKEMTEKDYLIICGDFGGIFTGDNEEKYWLKWLSDKKFTTLFIDGNHENFDLLSSFPEIEFHGGKAHKISDKIYHLMRGQVFEIDGKKIFTLGGASSHDKEYRTEGKNWWKAELPSEHEYQNALDNLKKSNNIVDIIISHCAPTDVQYEIDPLYKADALTDFLQDIKNSVRYTKWFFGHYHVDLTVDEKHIAMYDKIVLL